MSPEMKRVYVVRWAKVNGRFTKWELFTSREIAVRLLNRLILDLGETDAKLKTDKVTEEFYREYFSA